MKRPQYVDSTWSNLDKLDGLDTRLPPEPHAHAEVAPLPDAAWLAADVEVRDYNDRPTRMVSFWIATALLITVTGLLIYALPMLTPQ